MTSGPTLSCNAFFLPIRAFPGGHVTGVSPPSRFCENSLPRRPIAPSYTPHTIQTASRERRKNARVKAPHLSSYFKRSQARIASYQKWSKNLNIGAHTSFFTFFFVGLYSSPVWCVGRDSCLHGESMTTDPVRKEGTEEIIPCKH